MALWNRRKPDTLTVPAPSLSPEVEELIKLIPERDDNEELLWQRYVDRIIQRFDGLPAPDGGDSFVRVCLAAGCQAVPVVHRSRLWSRDLSQADHHSQVRVDLEKRVRLGLFLRLACAIWYTLCAGYVSTERRGNGMSCRTHCGSVKSIGVLFWVSAGCLSASYR